MEMSIASTLGNQIVDRLRAATFVRTLSAAEVSTALSHLGMSTIGLDNDRANRLVRGLTGDFSQADYMPIPGIRDPQKAERRRATLRASYIEDIDLLRSEEPEIAQNAQDTQDRQFQQPYQPAEGSFLSNIENELDWLQPINIENGQNLYRSEIRQPLEMIYARPSDSLIELESVDGREEAAVTNGVTAVQEEADDLNSFRIPPVNIETTDQSRSHCGQNVTMEMDSAYQSMARELERTKRERAQFELEKTQYKKWYNQACNILETFTRNRQNPMSSTRIQPSQAPTQPYGRTGSCQTQNTQDRRVGFNDTYETRYFEPRERRPENANVTNGCVHCSRTEPENPTFACRYTGGPSTSLPQQYADRPLTAQPLQMGRVDDARRNQHYWENPDIGSRDVWERGDQPIPQHRPIIGHATQRQPADPWSNLAPMQTQESIHRGDLPPAFPHGRSTTYPQTPNASECYGYNYGLSKPRDIGEVVRKWNARFSGKAQDDIEEFLTRVEEAWRLAYPPIREIELVEGLSQMLQGKALKWYRVEKSKWTGWLDFCAEARREYGMTEEERSRLIVEISHRTQGPQELVRDYYVGIMNICDRMPEKMSERQKLDILYQNMSPDLKLIFGRNEVSTLLEFKTKAQNAEVRTQARNTYKPPPAPDKSLLPDAACQATEKSKAKQQPTVAAISISDKAELTQLIKQLIKQLLAEQSQPAASASTPSGRKYFRSSTNKQKDQKKDQPNTGQDKAAAPPKDKKHPNNERGKSADKPEQTVKKKEKMCWTCKLPGYTKYTCPNCSGKGEGKQ